MERTFIVLNRGELVRQLVEFVRLSHECTIAPQKEGGSGSRMGLIPEALRTSPKNSQGHETVFLSDAEAEAYDDLRHHLGHLRETEWLGADQLEATLWEVACEIALAPTDFNVDVKRLARAERLALAVIRELRQYDVIFSVLHITPPANPVWVWGTQLLTATSDVLAPFVQNARAEDRADLAALFVGKAALILPMEGTAPGPAIERARRTALHRLHALRASLATQWQTHHRQLLFALGNDALARAATGPPDGLHAWAAPPAMPIDLEIHAGHTDRLREMQQVFADLQGCEPSVAEAVERALEWIGRGLCRQWPGDALRDYTTAAEVLLVATDEQKGSVLVPYRMLALADLHGKPVIHPSVIRYALYRRGIVVHQGFAEAGDGEATHQMLSAARDCVSWLVRFAASQPNEDHATLLNALDTPALRSKAIRWLKLYPDPWTKKLLAGIESQPN